ncbi:Respiration factor 2 [Lasiodiplodia theobromae]|uniref:Respiration factor 2 n=1 Tax=Lasiodiplodia theobromae TaxID=45133 RepID=A0A5N5CVV8_9PEZI|nr:Respiration factor 2 [Lasiodiplodia theobromae]
MHQENDTASQPLPRVMREKVTSPPKLTADDAVYEHLCGDIRSRTKEEPDLTAIPKSKELERLMEAYVSCFHCHFPIIHIASLDLSTAPGPLILSICAIGALYRLDRRRAVQLHNIASSSLHRSVSSQPSSFSSPASARPLWVVQSCLLLSMYAAFSGQSAAVLSTVEKMGFFKIEFQLKRTALQKSAQEPSSPCWDEWIRRESTKRLLCGIFIMTNLFSVTYGTTPLFSIEQDLSFETPSEEKLWDARTAELWEDARASRHAASPPPTTLREAIVATFFNQQPDSGPTTPPPQVSGFTALLITHAANVHMWSIIQFSASFPAPLSHSILTTTFASLVRWHTALGHGSVETPEAAYYNNASSIPLVFNCHALLRIAYVRLFGNSCAFPKMILLASDDGEIAAAMANYVAAPQPRNAFLTKSIAKAYEGFITPVRLGHLLIKKTAALSWSVEHAVAAWDSVLFVSKWVHAVQMEGGAADGEEERIVAQLEGLLEEMEYGYDGVGSLAAAVTRAWAGFLTDTWVWGVTPRMGYILMQLATAYDNAYQAALS